MNPAAGTAHTGWHGRLPQGEEEEEEEGEAEEEDPGTLAGSMEVFMTANITK